jgi:hypothetical protein
MGVTKSGFCIGGVTYGSILDSMSAFPGKVFPPAKYSIGVNL